MQNPNPPNLEPRPSLDPQGPVFNANARNNVLVSWIKNHKLVSFILFLAFMALIWSSNGGNDNLDTQYTYERIGGKLVKVEASSTPSVTPENMIIFVVVQGNDNHTLAVRRAITGYLNTNPDLEVSLGSRLYTETVYTQTITDKPLPAIGSRLIIPLDTIQSLLTDQYDALTQYQKNTWQRNAGYVRF
jgi:hypothetical protein